jgi:hypothetical protein
MRRVTLSTVQRSVNIGDEVVAFDDARLLEFGKFIFEWAGRSAGLSVEPSSDAPADYLVEGEPVSFEVKPLEGDGRTEHSAVAAGADGMSRSIVLLGEEGAEVWLDGRRLRTLPSGLIRGMWLKWERDRRQPVSSLPGSGQQRDEIERELEAVFRGYGLGCVVFHPTRQPGIYRRFTKMVPGIPADRWAITFLTPDNPSPTVPGLIALPELLADVLMPAVISRSGDLTVDLADVPPAAVFSDLQDLKENYFGRFLGVHRVEPTTSFARADALAPDPLSPLHVGLSNGVKVDIPRSFLRFVPNEDAKGEEPEGSAATVTLDGEQVSPAVAIRRFLEKAGWEIALDGAEAPDVYEVDSRIGTMPIRLREVFERVVQRAGGLEGCWDLVAWRGDKLTFVRARPWEGVHLDENERRWLEAALSEGLSRSSFLVVGWFASPSPSRFSSTANLSSSQQGAEPAIVSSPEDDPLEQQIRVEYPFPLAFGYRGLTGIADVRELYKDQLRVAENLLAFLGSVSLALLKPRDRSQIDARKYWQGGISPGHWKEATQKCSTAFGSYDNHPLAEAISELHIASSKSKFGADAGFLISAKNDYKHDRGPIVEQDFIKPAQDVQARIRRAMGALAFFTQFPIRLVADCKFVRSEGKFHARCWRVTGDHPALPQEQIWTKTPLEEGELFLELDQDQRVSLFPFITAGHCSHCGTREFYFIDKWNESKRLAYLKSFDRGHTQEGSEVFEGLMGWIAEGRV